MRINDVEVESVPTQVGKRIRLSILTDNIPAVADLDRGEAFMLADELVRLARRVKV